MADKISPERRSWNMSQIHTKDTSVEVKVRKYLFSLGLRYRKNVASLPGKPDIVFPKYHAVVFIHGCFWHRHEGCIGAHVPKTRQDYWLPKFERNVENDKKHYHDLQEMGWRPIVVWECDVKKHFEETMAWLLEEIKNT